MSLTGILSIARTAMNTAQTAVQVASHNISNAQTEGYSRQTAVIEATPPLRYPYGSLGTGAQVATIQRSRDALLDQTYRTDAGAAAGADSSRDTLSSIEGVFGEPSDTGLSNSIDAFWSSWSDLSSDPTSMAARGVVRERGAQVAGQLNDFARRLDTLAQTTNEHIGASIDQINQLTSSIASLNPQILADEAGGASANDLRDSRDLAVDKLAKLTGGTVVNHDDGSVSVYVGGRAIVDGPVARALTTSGGQPPKVVFKDSGAQLSQIGGSLGAYVDAVTTTIPNVSKQLDALADGLVTSVNTIHNGATLASGAAAGNFFETSAAVPPGNTARGIRLASTLTGAADVAAAGAGKDVGNNDVALALAQLRDTTRTFADPDGSSTTASIGDYCRHVVAGVATASQSAADNATVHDTLASHSDTLRQSVSSVSTDDELVSIINHQHSYSAAAKLVSTVDQMMQTILDMKQ